MIPRCKGRPKSTIMKQFLGILENLEETKVTLDIETRKNYELGNLPTH